MRTLAMILLFAANSFAQNSGMTARQLYLQPESPPPGGSQSTPRPRPRPKPNPPLVEGSNPPQDPIVKPPPPPETAIMVPAALHLGLRYNVLKVDPESKAAREVDPDTNFRVGDCLAIRFTPNRSGYIYVFNEGSSGAWQMMLPSPSMPNESKLLKAGVNTRIPQEDCFRINDPPGTDKLLIVLTEKDEDEHKLDDALQHSAQGGNQNLSSVPASQIGEIVIAMEGGAPKGSQESQRLTSRDLTIEKVGQPLSSNEPPNSVYIAKTAAGKSDRIVIEIKIRHE
jgi:Domain of unknown function (DUF4384)